MALKRFLFYRQNARGWPKYDFPHFVRALVRAPSTHYIVQSNFKIAQLFRGRCECECVLLDFCFCSACVSVSVSGMCVCVCMEADCRWRHFAFKLVSMVGYIERCVVLLIYRAVVAAGC